MVKSCPDVIFGVGCVFVIIWVDAIAALVLFTAIVVFVTAADETGLVVMMELSVVVFSKTVVLGKDGSLVLTDELTTLVELLIGAEVGHVCVAVVVAVVVVVVVVVVCTVVGE